MEFLLAITLVRKQKLALLLLIAMTAGAHAQNKPLRIVAAFTFPFVMQGNHHLYGFDVDMMNYICSVIKRDCKYQLIDYDQLIPTIENKKADVAIGGITFNAQSAGKINFTLPYLITKERFIARSNMKNEPVTLNLLKKSRIGGIIGGVTTDIVKSLGVTHPTIVGFHDEGTLINALSTGAIDLASVHQATAMYWQDNSAGEIIALEIPIKINFSLGIAVNRDETELLKSIDQALIQFQNGQGFVTTYRTYIGNFNPFQSGSSPSTN